MNTVGAANIPSKNATRQPMSPTLGGSSPPKMPLMPKMRPLINIKTAEATPSSRPPVSDAQGVK